ncbi:MAG: tripartite tricarboxylate transporter substrate binding protein [Pseudomonadota bacterium]
MGREGYEVVAGNCNAAVRAAISTVLLGLAMLTTATDTAAEYPEHPIKFIVPSAAGGSPDRVSRILAAELTKQMGQQVLVDNRPGGAVTIGLGAIIKSRPDGYTIGYGNVLGLAINRTFLATQPYDLDKGVQYIARTGYTPNLLAANASLPVKSVSELLDYARQNPGKLGYGTSAMGSTSHIGMELLQIMTGTKLLHVPYKSAPQAIVDLIAGRVQVMFDNLPSIAPHIKAGKLTGLGQTGSVCSKAMPDLPTIAEAGVPGFEIPAWSGVIVPAGVPKAIVARLNTEVNKALSSPALRERFDAIGYEIPGNTTPEQFAEFVKKETAKWADVVKRSGAKNE